MSLFDPIPPCPPAEAIHALLGHPDTTLKAIEAFGLTFDASQSGPYFRWQNAAFVQGYPAWVRELLAKAQREARAQVQHEIKCALGLVDPTAPLGFDDPTAPR